MQIGYSASNKVGEFFIPFEALNDGTQRPLLQGLFSLGVVLHVEDHINGRGKRYVMASELFEPLTEGEEIPEYRLEIALPHSIFPREDLEQRRTNANGYGFVAVRKIIVRVPPVQVVHRQLH